MFNFMDLDETTRQCMVAEIALAESTENIYYSTRFITPRDPAWVPLLKEAAALHNEHWLAFQIEARGMLKGVEGSRTRSGGYTLKHVPHTAAETLADGQFNRFYMAGVCRRVSNGDAASLVVYRAKESVSHRGESDAAIGSRPDHSQLLVQLRNVESSLRHSNKT